MKLNLVILLVTCLSCWFTPADSTGLLGAKIAAGVKGATLLGSSALDVKSKILKGAETLLGVKGAILHNVHTAIADAEQKPPVTVTRKKPTYILYEQGNPPVSPVVAGFQLRTIHDRPMEMHSVRLVPFDVIPMELRTASVKTRPFHIKFAEFKKKGLLGLFKKMHGAVVNKKKAIAELITKHL